jgi:MFS family permease
MRGRYLAAAAFSQQVGYAAGPALGLAIWTVWGSGLWWLCGLVTVVAVLATLAGMHRSRGGVLPDGAVPDGAVPDGAVPDGAVPDGAVPDGAPAAARE